MAIRLIPMRRVLSETGSIYLHCDPTASHYLKLIMDAIFGFQNFLNEIVWHYQTGGAGKRWYSKKHDVILFYAKTEKYLFNPNAVLVHRTDKALARAENPKGARISIENTNKLPMDVWADIQALNPMATERLGYPTQKPVSLLERIIKASSNENDLILDPFCGCGTTVHAAEKLKRRWIGIDISTFSIGLIKERILNNFQFLVPKDIESRGTPYNLTTARKLANQDPFEFEKWACGTIGAHGMYHNPGDRGADKGVDGVLNFATFNGLEEKVEKHYAIIQVKAGRVTPDSVRALTHTVEQFDARAGILVCFDKYMSTVENNRKKDTYSDLTGTYPVIQGFSVEKLLAKERPQLPPLVLREDGKLEGLSLFN